MRDFGRVAGESSNLALDFLFPGLGERVQHLAAGTRCGPDARRQARVMPVARGWNRSLRLRRGVGKLGQDVERTDDPDQTVIRVDDR